MFLPKKDLFTIIIKLSLNIIFCTSEFSEFLFLVLFMTKEQLRGVVVLQFKLEQGLASFLYKVPESKHFWLYSHMVATAPPCHGSCGIAIDTT